MGEDLGPGAHLTALRRTRSGSFGLDQAVPGDDLASGAERLISLADALPELPAVTVSEAGRERVRHGRELPRDSVLEGFPEGPFERVRVLDEDGVLLALAVPRGADAAEAPPVAHDAPARPRPHGLTPIDGVCRESDHTMVDKASNPQ